MKHAFPQKSEGGKRSGVLFVQFAQRSRPLPYMLCVQDTGIGFPSDFDLKKSKSLGMCLVYGLAEKELGGKVSWASSGSGSSISIEFKDPNPPSQQSTAIQLQ